MYHLAISLSLLFAPIATNIAIATEAEDFHRYYVSYFNGIWIFEQDGKETVITCNDKQTYNFCSGWGGQVNELWGYNPAQKAWGAYGRGGDLVWEWVMDRHTGFAITAGVTLSSVGKLWNPDGSEVSRKQELTIIDENNFKLQIWEIQDGGEDIAKPSVKARRVQ